MTAPEWLRSLAEAWWPTAATIAASLIVLFAVRRYVTWRYKATPIATGLLFPLLMLLLTGIALVAVIVVLPIGDSIRGQLLGLLGILVTAAIALSSTTFIGNAMAGMMLRSIRNIRPGDFVRVGEHFGRVSEQGLLHTEIQTEDRDLTTLPNLHLVTNPVTVVRSSGTILSATVSLGYSVPRTLVEECLLEAAASAGLDDCFLQIVELGDHAISYRVAGMLEDVKHLLTSRSRLRACMLDGLHAAGIEIVSPGFMNYRVLKEGVRVMPKPAKRRQAVVATDNPESVIFDKAEEAETRAQLEEAAKAAATRIEELEDELDKADEDARSELEAEIQKQHAELARLRDALGSMSNHGS